MRGLRWYRKGRRRSPAVSACSRPALPSQSQSAAPRRASQGPTARTGIETACKPLGYFASCHPGLRAWAPSKGGSSAHNQPSTSRRPARRQLLVSGSAMTLDGVRGEHIVLLPPCGNAMTRRRPSGRARHPAPAMRERDDLPGRRPVERHLAPGPASGRPRTVRACIARRRTGHSGRGAPPGGDAQGGTRVAPGHPPAWARCSPRRRRRPGGRQLRPPAPGGTRRSRRWPGARGG